MLTCPDCDTHGKAVTARCVTHLKGCIYTLRSGTESADTTETHSKRVRYFCILTTCRGYQVIRVAQAHYSSKKESDEISTATEVVQRWNFTRRQSDRYGNCSAHPSYYCDHGSLYSDMEAVRPYNSLYDDVCNGSEVYPPDTHKSSAQTKWVQGDFLRHLTRLLSRGCFPTHGLNAEKSGEDEDMTNTLPQPRNAECSGIIPSSPEPLLPNQCLNCGVTICKCGQSAAHIRQLRRPSAPRRFHRRTRQARIRMKPSE